MERYLGGDVHAASVTFSVLNESGKQLRRDVIETNGPAGRRSRIASEPRQDLADAAVAAAASEEASPRDLPGRDEGDR